MTWRNGLFEQNPDATYEAADDRFLIKTLFTEGVINLSTGGGLVVQRQAGAAMEVYVPPLDCVIDGDDVLGQNSYLCRMTAGEPVTVPPSSGTNPRIDLIIAEFTDRQYKTPTSAQPGGPHLRLVPGTPAANPVAPSIATLPTAIALATIAVAANATAITNANITDLRTQSGAVTLKVGTQFTPMTTTQRDALTPYQGQSIFNTTANRNETYLGTTIGWVGSAGVNVVTVTASGTIPIPAGARAVQYTLIGAGAGGFGGFYAGSNDVALPGGPGGGAGGVRQGVLDISALTSLGLVIGAAGTGGPASTTQNSSSPGTAGGASTLTAGGTTITAPGGGAAIGQPNSSPSAGRYAGAGASMSYDGDATYEYAVRSGDGGWQSPALGSYTSAKLGRSGSPVAGLVCGGSAGTGTPASGNQLGAGGTAGTPLRAASPSSNSGTTGTPPATRAGTAATDPGCGGGGGGSSTGGSSFPSGAGGAGFRGVAFLTFFG